jgi:hypothetical protein
MRLLFIEDQPDVVEPVMRSLKRRAHDCAVAAFADSAGRIAAFDPDIVVLDLLEGGVVGTGSAAGVTTYDAIWKTRFCPIVVYSARPDLITDERDAHPFVKAVQKGSRSGAKLQAALEGLRPHVDALREAEGHIRQQFALALRDVAPHAFGLFKVATERNEAILRSGRRRLAAFMDDLARHGQELASWEQYLCPPVSNDVLLGDVIVEHGRPKDEPSSFRLVLTPSCDLVASGGRKAKVADLLVARCCRIRDAVELTNLKGIPVKKLKDRVSAALVTPGYNEAVLLLPALAGKIPAMAANLRDLALVPVVDVGAAGRPFERVASIDSPFRELVAWAYMQVACRPGLPDRDFKGWCAEVLQAYETDAAKKGA